MTDNVNNVQLPVEQILAATLNKVGKIELTQSDLLQNYSSKSIAVIPAEDGQSFTLELVDNSEVEIQAENE
jgi:hypothetical protein